MPFIWQNGDDSRPKNAATCPGFLDKICVKFGRTMNRHILLSLQKTIDSCVNYFLDQAKKQNIRAVNVCAKIGRKTATMKNQIGNDLSKLSFWKSAAKTINGLFRHENAVLFFNIQAYVNEIGTYVQRDVSRNTKRKNKVVRIDRRTENQSLLSE